MIQVKIEKTDLWHCLDHDGLHLNLLFEPAN